MVLKAMIVATCLAILACSVQAQGDSLLEQGILLFTADESMITIPCGLAGVILDTAQEKSVAAPEWSYIGSLRVDSTIDMDGLVTPITSIAQMDGMTIGSEALENALSDINARILLKEFPQRCDPNTVFYDTVLQKWVTEPDLTKYFEVHFSPDFPLDSAMGVMRNAIGSHNVGRVSKWTDNESWMDSVVTPWFPNDSLAQTAANWSLTEKLANNTEGCSAGSAWGLLSDGNRGNVTIAVIDQQGVWTGHSDLSGRWDGVGETVVGGTHGTSVAGLALGTANNGGIVGLAPDATVHTYAWRKTQLGGAESRWVDFLRAIDDSASVIVLASSIGTYVTDTGGMESLHEVLIDAYLHHIPVVVSSGNDNAAPQTASYPGLWDSLCICVGAHHENGYKLYGSQYGCGLAIFDQDSSCIPDVLAPGVGIPVASFYVDSLGDTVSWYEYADGTSVSAPIVAGICAMAKARVPNVTCSQLESFIESTAWDTLLTNRDPVLFANGAYGAGLVDAFDLLWTTIHQTASESATGPSDSVECLIITSDSLSDAFETLATRKRQLGTSAEVVTVEQIDANAAWTGDDLAEEIRSCISAYYATGELKWVVLGGDDGVVPLRYAYNNLYGPGVSFASDYYYACLDGDWNSDGDSLYGEIEDSVDLAPEVAVGRLPFDTPGEVSAFLSKLDSYELASTAQFYPMKALSIGSRMFQDGDGRRMNELLLDDLDGFAISELYGDTSGVDLREVYFNLMNSGQGIVIKHGNAQYEGNYRLKYAWTYVDHADVDTLDNAGTPSVIWSSTCWNHRLDSEDAMSRHYMVHPTGGAVAYIGTTCNDFVLCSFPMEREFFQQLTGEGPREIGALLNLGKQAIISESEHEGGYRHAVMSYALSGDPQMRIWTTTPWVLMRAHCDTVESAVQLTIVDTLRYPNNYHPVVGATVCLMKDNEVYEEAVTNEYGAVSFNTMFRSGGTATIAVPSSEWYEHDIDEITVLPCCEVRGDIEGDGFGPDISDLVYLVSYMFQNGPEPDCATSSDINGSGTGPDISDLVYLVTYMFSQGPEPPSCQ